MATVETSVTSGLRSFKVDISNLGNSPGGQPITQELVPLNVPVYAFKLRHISTQYMPYAELLLDQGATILPLRRQGEVFRLGIKYDRGIVLNVPNQGDTLIPIVPAGTSVEVLVATTPEAALAMDEGPGDPWESAVSYLDSKQQAGGAATFPQVAFGSPNTTGFGLSQQARVVILYISTNVAGEICIQRSRQTVGAATASGKRTPPDLTYPSTNKFFQLAALGTVGAFPVGPWLVRQFLQANFCQPFALGIELVGPDPAGAINGDSLTITGPANTATLDVTVDWQEKRCMT